MSGRLMPMTRAPPSANKEPVHTHGHLDQWRGGALLAGQRMTIVAAVGTMDMKEVRAFSRMEEAHEITMKIRGAIITTVFISPAERRTGPPSRREEYPYRGPREDPHPGRPMEFGARAPPPHGVRNQGIYPAPRSLPESGEDTLVQAILNLDRGEDRDHYRRKAAPFPPIRERSPVRREVARSPHSRSGSSVSSRGYSPDRAKSLPFPTQQGVDGPEGYAGVSEPPLWGALFPQQTGHDTLDKIPGLSREGSPHSATSIKPVVHCCFLFWGHKPVTLAKMKGCAVPPVKLALMAPAAACCGDSTNTHAGFLEPSQTKKTKEGDLKSSSGSGCKPWWP
ncbi:hypothetical protein E3U43_021017 [Larimichthys crocea]|uniref:Uncharacterized protein n=1 Tax=Larimichthys crocea TaxID=215358 RepID=A0ACD3Q6Z3_LARCR|nr:hypothetical protein E3U43_021017 [Larimichthys crocea]